MVINMGFPSDGEANQGWKLYLTSLIMVLSAGIIVAVRVVTRFRAVMLGADDYTIVASLVLSIVLSVTIQLAVVNGYGQHKRDLSKEELRTCLWFFWIAQTPYKIVVCLNKTSIIFLYMRIFISRHFRWLCYSTLAIVLGSGVATIFATIFQCVPIERSWNKTIEGSCIDSSKFWLANAILNISTDVIVLALPIREIFKLQLKLQEKIMLCSVFLLGGFVTITSTLRVTAVANSVHNQQDQTWNFIPRGIWTLVEANLGIICASLTVLRQVAKRTLASMSRWSKSDKYNHGCRGSGATSHANGSTGRNATNIITLQHFELDETVQDDDTSINIHVKIGAEARKDTSCKSIARTDIVARSVQRACNIYGS
ncbi:hypothetical protein P153DRAFT_378743 [Dothidotthia symphoricarpi CBS 119687]|uniref:Rhodopsin domain-containing protein n=1 Tax=Dothidotthia symphoricarpi CBS 119687 TaxID=1392245 RepID=A0A6A6A243_9PLEO|nr:uncharacterized protein P153DRAFT_378743 [Dothidotthia symphoricarpi CBS 119687]KAF2125243.1 hypothetical protein P153DRAFT_378743 [Dothidotthia symphoricarpi CBS 119687]